VKIHLSIPYVPGLDDTLLCHGGDRVETLAPGKKICVHPVIEQAGLEDAGSAALTAYATFPESVSRQAAAAWLWGKLEAVHGASVAIDHRTITLECEESLRRLLEERGGSLLSGIGQAASTCDGCQRTDCDERRPT
jgi:hypothetical protein